MLACPLSELIIRGRGISTFIHEYVDVDGVIELPFVYAIFDTFPKCTATAGVLLVKSMGVVTAVLSLPRITVILTPSFPEFQ